MTPLHHREIGLVGAGLLDDDVMMELICDRVHLCDEMISLVFKMKPLDRLMLVTDSMAASWLADGPAELGGLPVRVVNGIVRLENGALAGSTLRYYEALRNVHEVTGLSFAELVGATSLNQARSLGLEGVGEILPGFAADLVVWGGSGVPEAVFVDGRDVLPSAVDGEG
jgi:N-acetylglucosamine-6-phosphate deacetylase